MLVVNKILKMKEKTFTSLCLPFTLPSFFAWVWRSASLVKLPLCLVSSLFGFPPSLLSFPLPPSSPQPTALSSAPSRETEETRSPCLSGKPAVIELWACSAAGRESRSRGGQRGAGGRGEQEGWEQEGPAEGEGAAGAGEAAEPGNLIRGESQRSLTPMHRTSLGNHINLKRVLNPQRFPLSLPHA